MMALESKRQVMLVMVARSLAGLEHVRRCTGDRRPMKDHGPASHDELQA